jgi:tyrosine-protein kinase Etk/Wzc
MGNDSAFYEEFLKHSESLDFQKVLKVILSRWYWVAGSLLFFAFLCFLLLKLIRPQYITSINLKYQDKQTELDEITSNRPTYLIHNGSSDYLTEKYNIRSREVVEDAIARLNHSFTFYRLKDFRHIDVYPYKPLLLKVLSFDEAVFAKGKFLLSPTLDLTYESENDSKIFRLEKGTVITIPGLSFQIEQIGRKEKFDFELVYNHPSSITRDLIKSIEVSETEDEMPVLTLSFKHQNKPFSKDFLEKLLESYQAYDLRQKQRSSDLTLLFINDQVKIYSASLKKAARELELFKQHNAVLDISASATEISEKTRDLVQQKNESGIQKAYISMLEKNLGNTFEQVDYLSVGLDGTTDPTLTSLLEQFNILISRRKELLLKYSPNASVIKILDEELSKTRRQILDNISLQKQKNAGLTKILDQHIGSLQKRFRQIPALEKNFIYLQSNFEINKNIYSLLLNKEIEASIVRAGMLPSFRIITLMEVEKVSPKPAQIITLSLFLGLLTGMTSIFLARYLNQKFVKMDLAPSSDPVQRLGIVQHYSEKPAKEGRFDLNVLISDQSIFAESVSTLRTRLSFLKWNDQLHPEKGKQIMITSEKSGEGKTFVSINLALSLHKTAKKVIVIGCDLRRSKLHLYFGNANENGLSSYLQQKVDVSSLIKSSVIPGLDYIPAGPPPFNPAELLQKPQFRELLSYCRENYDYVLLDSAPVGLVSDNIPLFSDSHLVLFILRWLYSDKDAFHLPEQLAKDYEINKIQIIINDFYPDDLYGSITSSAYQAPNYGYHYSDQYNEYFSKKQNGTLNKVKKGLGFGV